MKILGKRLNRHQLLFCSFFPCRRCFWTDWQKLFADESRVVTHDMRDEEQTYFIGNIVSCFYQSSVDCYVRCGWLVQILIVCLDLKFTKLKFAG